MSGLWARGYPEYRLFYCAYISSMRWSRAKEGKRDGGKKRERKRKKERERGRIWLFASRANLRSAIENPLREKERGARQLDDPRRRGFRKRRAPPRGLWKLIPAERCEKRTNVIWQIWQFRARDQHSEMEVINIQISIISHTHDCDRWALWISRRGIAIWIIGSCTRAKRSCETCDAT